MTPKQKEQEFWIEGTLPGLNEMLKAKRGVSSRSQVDGYSALKKEMGEIVGWCILQAKLKPMREGAVYFSFHWTEPNRKRDKDNIAAGKKFILDALVGLHIIENDGWNCVTGWEDHFKVDKENPGVRVRMAYYWYQLQ